MDHIIEMHAITKAFPRVVANDDVNLDIKEGEIHALVGENGAGKTTLMNILYGLVKPDHGRIVLRGNPLPLQTGFLGLEFGIGMIHQHFMLIGQFTVLENIVLGAEPRRGLLLDRATARSRIRDLIDRYGIDVDIDKRVDDLSVGEEQKVEILKVLYRDAQIIIMDEPTAVLTPQETKRLFSTVKTLTDGGRTVIFITHKLEEVMEAAQTVTVMRAGRVIGTTATADTDIPSLAEMMMGRKMESVPQRKTGPSAVPVLEVAEISLRSRKGQDLLSKVSLSVNRGEVFGICGVEGNGQDELFEVLIGLQKPSHGTVRFLGRDITFDSTSDRLKAGLAHIPPDRGRMGFIGDFNLRENLILGRHRDEDFSGRVFLKRGAIARAAVGLINRFSIEPPLPEMRSGYLSGGNQQKVIVARELSRNPELLIASQPTRGLDISAAGLIHRLLINQVENGKSVLLVSADLSEIMTLADRIGVMYRGTIVGVVERAGASEERLGLMMAGVKT
jgi:ABC-type uncharacterized transport system ATPase subunit